MESGSMDAAWLHCQVSRGQFQNEAAVKVTDFAGHEFSLFVPSRFVTPAVETLGDNWEDGQLEVEILESRDGFHLVYLPGETFANGRAITVREEQISRKRPRQPA
jgi:hypothetical protein